MVDHPRIGGDVVTPLDAGWSLLVTGAGACASPTDLPKDGDWIPASVPGTAAAALLDAGRFDPADPTPLHEHDIWYRRRLDEPPGEAALLFEGLATLAEVWIGGERVHRSETMYRAFRVPVRLAGPVDLAIVFRALRPRLDAKGPRARWRPQMMSHQGLRLVRTTLFGWMPGWCPDIPVVGPWRPIALVRPGAATLRDLRIRATMDDDGTPRLVLSADLARSGLAPVCRIADRSFAMTAAGEGRYAVDAPLPGLAPWWPHTHGEPALHALAIEVAGTTIDLGRTGFRRIDVDRGPDGDGFALLVNGTRIFCRGAVWTSADLLRLPGDRDGYRPWIERARAGGMNMLRIGGTMAPETRAFFELCDEAGILVWQDFPFANFDYPARDPSFAAEVRAEADGLLAATQGCPSLAVLCGGSEMHQQAAMLGLPHEAWSGPLTDEILPAVAGDRRPDVPYVPNSPHGGAMPFAPGAGIAHYYGVGAYRRPLEDARRADVRFAAECLAFSNPPDAETLEHAGLGMPGHDPRWKARLPRDRGVGWDFEDVRDHYLRLVYGLDPLDLRYGDPAGYLARGAAAVAEVMEATFAEWRRSGSRCAGALVWTFQDLVPGAGWGVVASDGRPKAAWYALKRAFRPVQVLLLDEGTNGIDVHVLNDTPHPRALEVDIACLRDARTPVASGRRDLDMPGRGALRIPATDLFGAFFDTGLAFRFGPPSHDVTVARLVDRGTGETLAEAFHFPMGRRALEMPGALAASIEGDVTSGWSLQLETDRLAPSLSIRADGFEPEDDGFHLSPLVPRRIRLHRRPGTPADTRPAGTVVALGGRQLASFRAS